MTIKSDKWIRRMAQEHGMIEPFEPGQERTVHDKKIVSYGLSPCADEFKIFTNINSTIVDPKKFDEKSFVDLKNDVCINDVWENCAQALFFESDEICEVSYKDRGGKYQGQSGVTLPRA